MRLDSNIIIIIRKDITFKIQFSTTEKLAFKGNRSMHFIFHLATTTLQRSFNAYLFPLRRIMFFLLMLFRERFRFRRVYRINSASFPLWNHSEEGCFPVPRLKILHKYLQNLVYSENLYQLKTNLTTRNKTAVDLSASNETKEVAEDYST